MHAVELVREYEKAKAGIVGLSEVNRLGVMVAGLDFNCQPNLLGASDAAGMVHCLSYLCRQRCMSTAPSARVASCCDV